MYSLFMCLFYFISYVFLLLYLYILIVIYVLFCSVYPVFIVPTASATLTEVFPCFFLSCKANAGV